MHTIVIEILEESGAHVFVNRLLSLYVERAGGSLADLSY